MPEFTCQSCGDRFSLPESVLERYPGWTPRLCRTCHQGGSAEGKPAGSRPPSSTSGSRPRGGRAEIATTEEVLDRYADGPTDGVFTDGGSVPNPGPGGWGAVYVVGNEIVAEDHGFDPETTNNRMELTALIRGAELVPEGVTVTVYTDSNLVMRTVTEWAAGWEKRGWKRKSGPVENLDLVKKAFYTFRRRPELSVEWIAAHSGYRWNEYADALASKWRLQGG